MDLGRYSKLIAAILGNAVAIVIAYLASRGLAECKMVGDIEECAVFGFTQAQITAALLAVFNTAFVYFFPPNKPPA